MAIISRAYPALYSGLTLRRQLPSLPPGRLATKGSPEYAACQVPRESPRKGMCGGFSLFSNFVRVRVLVPVRCVYLSVPWL